MVGPRWCEPRGVHREEGPVEAARAGSQGLGDSQPGCRAYHAPADDDEDRDGAHRGKLLEQPSRP